MDTPPQPSPVRPRLTIVSPFVDKSHGTERVLAEQIERLASDYEIHLFSERVGGVDRRRVVWDRVYVPPGPHLFRYLWWFIANHVQRRRASGRNKRQPEIIYSAGVNCLDADVVCAHAVFTELRHQLRDQLRFSNNALKRWPVVLHRRIYYRVISFLERRIYRNQKLLLAAVFERTAKQIGQLCGRTAAIDVVYNAIDCERFNAQRLGGLRKSARAAFELSEDDVAVLLIGNDWKTKGLPLLLEAVARLSRSRVRVLVVGQDSSASYRSSIRNLGLDAQVRFLPARPDVEYYYASADIYASPSLGDSFALPVAEAMACSLPVITSRNAGVCAILHHGEDGLILENAADVATLAHWLRNLAENPAYRRSLGAGAARTAAQYTWERNVEQMRTLFERALKSRKLRLKQWSTAPTPFEKS